MATSAAAAPARTMRRVSRVEAFLVAHRVDDEVIHQNAEQNFHKAARSRLVERGVAQPKDERADGEDEKDRHPHAQRAADKILLAARDELKQPHAEQGAASPGSRKVGLGLNGTGTTPNGRSAMMPMSAA